MEACATGSCTSLHAEPPSLYCCCLPDFLAMMSIPIWCTTEQPHSFLLLTAAAVAARVAIRVSSTGAVTLHLEKAGFLLAPGVPAPRGLRLESKTMKFENSYPP